ncbi:MAG: DUF1801 domain-containing protein [Candidatus Eisenbacteria bacterium]
MAEAKTRRTNASVAAFIAGAGDETTRRDCATLVRMMEKVTGDKAAMWGPNIVGFGTYRYVYASGTTGDWPLAGFSPRKQNLTVYLMPGFDEHAALMKKLGKHKASKVCLYVKSLADVDLAVLEQLVTASVVQLRKTYPVVSPASAQGAKQATRKVV